MNEKNYEEKNYEEQKKLEKKLKNLDLNIGNLILTRAAIAEELAANSCLVGELVTDLDRLKDHSNCMVMDYS